MPKKNWDVEIKGAGRKIALEKGLLITSVPTVTIDGEAVEVTVAKAPGIVDREGMWSFSCDGVDCAIHMRPGWWTMSFELEVGGASADTGKKIEPSIPMPKWAYAFVIPCALLFCLGGALPAGLGVGGAMGCAAVSKNESMPIWLRVLICAVITCGCWLSILALGIAIGMARSG